MSASNLLLSKPLKAEEYLKRELGQFLTPEPVADLMASMFSANKPEWRLVDPGAGAGALSAALISRICRSPNTPTSIKLTAYEIDAAIVPRLRHTCESLQEMCKSKGIDFSANIFNADFVECASEIVQRDLLSRHNCSFNAAILNPPYRKISSNSRTRRLLRAAGIETSNLYTAFLALTLKLLGKSGELVSITPRSFCNGPYFQPFRQLFLDNMSLRRIHLFESRSAAFRSDAVLQENIIVHAVKARKTPDSVVVSMCNGSPGASVTERTCAYEEVVAPDDPFSFIHVVTNSSELDVREKISILRTTLPELGLTISTGRVVDFRATEFLRCEVERNTVLLIRPCHFYHGLARWPAKKEKKPCAILDVEATKGLLVPRGHYVLVKRFSAKEERRRIVASNYDPIYIKCDRVGFENHLNYFHADGKGLGKNLARGLTAFLNSTVVDMYFRHFSGHTQVNAADLRSLRYPTRAGLENLGRKAGTAAMDQLDLDKLVNREVF